MINRATVDSGWRWAGANRRRWRKAPFTRWSRASPRRAPVHHVAERLGVDMPICREIYGIMYENKPVGSAVQALMGREVRSETE